MRAAIQALAIGVLVSLAPAAAAAAELGPRLGARPYDAISGPVFAGDAIVSGTQTHTGYQLVINRGAQRTSMRFRIPGLKSSAFRYVRAHLEASAERVVLGISADLCEVPYCSVLRGSAYRAILTGPVGGDLTLVAGCTSAGDCDDDPCPVGTDPDVSGDAVAYSDCKGIHVRDLAPGASPAGRDYPERWAPRVAGSLVVRVKRSSATVSNWVTGDDVYSVSLPEYVSGYDLQADGKLAFTDGHDIAWASPVDPSLQRIAYSYIPVNEVRIAGDRIAARFHYPADDLYTPSYGQMFDVLELGKPPIEEYVPGAADRFALQEHDMDFDGERVIWAASSCRHAWLRAWSPGEYDISGELPLCPLPQIVRGSARFDRGRRLRVRLACKVPPGPACDGRAHRIGPRGKVLQPIGFSIEEGRAKTVRLPANGSLCRVGPGRARAKLLLESLGDELRTTLFPRGPTAGLRDC